MLDSKPLRERLGDYQGLRVLVTGHTGFKGAWLALWLGRLGARVSGLALPPEDGERSLFRLARVDAAMDSAMIDLRDREAVAEAFARQTPDIVFHLAAQSLVRRSYATPVETFATNVMGTAHVLEAARAVPSVRAVVVVTSDKCYENRETRQAFRETDPMGGDDPYSASKGCQELLTASYRHSFFRGQGKTLVASARAGNVIGGGDWCADRLLPDIARALAAGHPVVLRNPHSVRPWQHVLDPLSGYLLLGCRLLAGEADFAEGWNFGPEPGNDLTVGEVARRAVAVWGGGEIREEREAHAPPEAMVLRLDPTKALRRLGWRGRLDVDLAIAMTMDWYRRHAREGQAGPDSIIDQIEAFMDGY